ncbi:MAG TPA: recombinase family protein [Solirubrobacteraceae bacterium]|nr:recombinase family protein [Solirubrobacteraceae bacterium]
MPVVAYLPGLPPGRARAVLTEAGVPGAARARIVTERDGLAAALERAAAKAGSMLVLARLEDGARSVGELRELLAWTARERVRLCVLDVALDGAECADVPALLSELERGARGPRPGRGPRGRPGIAGAAPELFERMVAMREAGLSLQAIADTLQAEGVPTPRGGARWRPSSVQAALGYRRPRPPRPDLPPPPPPRHGPPGPGRPRGPRGPR